MSKYIRYKGEKYVRVDATKEDAKKKQDFKNAMREAQRVIKKYKTGDSIGLGKKKFGDILLDWSDPRIEHYAGIKIIDTKGVDGRQFIIYSIDFNGAPLTSREFKNPKYSSFF